jgi:hypothetical protein
MDFAQIKAAAKEVIAETKEPKIKQALLHVLEQARMNTQYTVDMAYEDLKEAL